MRLSGEGTATGQRGEGPNVQRRRGQQKTLRRGRSLRGRRDRSIVSRGTRCREANEDPETTTRLGHTDAKGDVTGSCFDGTGGGEVQELAAGNWRQWRARPRPS